MENKEGMGKLKIGNTIRAVVKSKQKDTEYIGKYAGVKGVNLLLYGYEVDGTYTGLVKLPIGSFNLSRSRLLGSKGKEVASKFEDYMEEKRKREEKERNTKDGLKLVRELSKYIKRNNIRNVRFMKVTNDGEFHIEVLSEQFPINKLDRISPDTLTGEFILEGNIDDYKHDIYKLWIKEPEIDKYDLVGNGRVEINYLGGGTTEGAIFGVLYKFEFGGHFLYTEELLREYVDLLIKKCIHSPKVTG